MLGSISTVCTERGRIARSQYIRHPCDPTIVLEAVISKDLWIWLLSLVSQDL
jgi:hypothetical protein